MIPMTQPAQRPPMRDLVGAADIHFITIDTLRHDVAVEEWAQGRTPHLADLLGPEGWQRRHTPGTFTYAAHQAFFAGFLPTPADDPKAARLFAVEFPGNEDTGADTWFTDASDIVTGLSRVGYRTSCVGGVGFFNPATALGSVLPALFDHSHWDSSTGVTDPDSFAHQLDHLERVVVPALGEGPWFNFVNVAAVHQPNCHHLPGRTSDDRDTHAAALRHVDSLVPRLRSLIAGRGRPALLVLTSDHGTAYGEDGLHGHRLAHEVTWTVPYAEVWLP